MSTIKPLAEVERMVTVAGGYGGVRIGGPKGPTWGVNGGLFDRQHDPPADAVAESLAHDINEAHRAQVAPLLALLAQAKAALADVTNVAAHVGPIEYNSAAWHHALRVLELLNAANPGEWVPAERLKECQAVLDDLRQEKADVWRGRAARALDMLRMGGAVDYAMAALEGKDE